MANSVAQGPWADYASSATPVTDSGSGPWSDYAAPASAAPATNPTQAAGEDITNAIAEPALSIGTGLVGAAAGGIAGLASGAGAFAGSLVGGESLGQATDAATQQAADTVSNVENAMTFQPKTAVGQAANTAAQYPLALVQRGADYAGQGASAITQRALTAAGMDPSSAARAAAAAGATVNTGLQALTGKALEATPALGGAVGRGWTAGGDMAARTAAMVGETTPATASAPAPAPEPVAPPKEAPGPVTAEQLRSGPDRLPPTPPRNAAPPAPAVPAPAEAPAPAVPAPAEAPAPAVPATAEAPATSAPPTETPPGTAAAPQGVEAATAAAVAAAPEAAASAAPEATAAADAAIGKAPPTDEAEIAGSSPSVPEQQARQGAIEQLQADTGAVMPNIRNSAITGDFRETGTDYQLAELGNPGMKTQLDQEQNALKAASTQQIRSAGGVTDGTGKPALMQRGQIISQAFQGISDWFDRNIKQLYRGADGAASQRPMTLDPNPQTGVGAFHQILSDPSQFTGIEGKQLSQDTQQVGRQFGLIGGNGFWSPTTVENAEKFRQWLGDQYTPRTGRVLGQLKDALDSDVAASGGSGLYERARALRFKRDQMMAGAKGIDSMMPETSHNGTVVTRPGVAHEDLPDHITNLKTGQFNHIINVLHDSSKLGDGELAADNAAAINEIRQHMAERLHESGTKQRDGFWDPHAYHTTLDNYSTKMPSVFSPEGMRRFQTIHDAGNALRVNKRYGGAIKQAQQFMQGGGWSPETRKRVAGAAQDLIFGRLGALGELTGIGGKIRGAVERRLPGGNVEANAETAFEKRVRPLGQRMPKQGGWIGDLRKSKLPEVEHSYDPESREHVVTSANGKTTAMQRGSDIQSTNTETNPAGRGKGENVARIAKLADTAHANGGVFYSDTQVSKLGQKSYPALAHLGYDVRPNPNVEVIGGPGTDLPEGTLRSTDGRPVFTVGPPKRPPLRQGYDPAAKILDEQVKQDVENAHRNPSAPRPGLVQEGKYPLSSRFPGQRGGPKYQATKTLENFVKSKAPPHIVDENGPSTWEDLQARGRESPLPINPTGAEGSIYSSTPSNIAFRAWHDATHLKLGAGFDAEGEMRVALEHQREAKAAGLSDSDRRALWADTWETFKHHEQTGNFPSEPRDFVGSKMAETYPPKTKTLAEMFPGQRGGPKAKGEHASTLNIGLNVGDPANGGRVMDPKEAKAAIKGMGYDVGKTSVVQSNTEPTLVADLQGQRMSLDDLHQLSAKLGQGVVAQRYPDGSGSMEGPAAKEWGDYNPAYFRMHDGTTAADHDTTVTNAQRVAFPGIYDKPANILSRVTTAPEDPIMKQLFGVSRKDLYDVAVGRTSNMKYELPGAAAKPQRSKAAAGVMNDKNAQRLVDLINEAKKNPDLYHGMAGWYVMDPLFKKVADTVGRKAAPAAYSRLNSYMGMASPGSDVNTEIARGTAAHMMDTQGRLDQFLSQGGRPIGSKGRPAELAAVPGHPYHSTAHGIPMSRYSQAGSLQMTSSKVPTYIAASGVPETGFQNHVAVGDSHFSRGLGLSDTRTNNAYTSSATTPEMQQVHPWYKEKVAKATGLPSTSAQAVQWGALSHETGVETPVGAPKLELFAQQVKKAATRLKITPEEALKRIILGTAHAG